MRAALLADVAEVRVTSRTARVHSLACDRTGACAAVELVGGRQVVTTGEAMPWRVLTNDTYAEPRVRLVELAALDFDCAAGARVLDVGADRWGRVAPWLRPYSLAANRDLLQRVVR